MRRPPARRMLGFSPRVDHRVFGQERPPGGGRPRAAGRRGGRGGRPRTGGGGSRGRTANRRVRETSGGHLAPSADPYRKHGAVAWRVEGGEGQFAGASDLITSNFFVDKGLAVVDHHFGVLLLP